MLAPDLVDAIFAKMMVRYGASWTSKWDGVPIHAVKRDWANELEGLSRAQLEYGMNNLPPDYPPTVLGLREVCIDAPEPEFKQLPSPPRDAKKAAALAAAAKALTIGRDQSSPKEWAWRLKAREEAGEKLTPTQRAMYRAVTDGESRDGAMSESDLTRTAALKAASSAQAKSYAKTHGIDLEKTT